MPLEYTYPLLIEIGSKKGRLWGMLQCFKNK